MTDNNIKPEDKEKEKFETGVSDLDLISQIKDWEKESEDLYSQLKKVWEVNLAYYKGDQTEVYKIYGKNSKAVENRIFMAVETMIPIATSRPPDIVVYSQEESEAAQLEAQNHQDVLNYHLDRLGLQEKAERWVRDMLIKRYGVFKVEWSKEMDNVNLRVIDPKRIRIPKYGKSETELKFIIEYLEMSYDQMIEVFTQAKVDKLGLPLTSTDEQKKIRKKNYSVTECWTNEFVVWLSGNTILEKKENPYYDFKNTKNNYFEYPKKPYIVKSLFETEESIIGDTDYVQQLIPIQDNINNLKRRIENISRKVSNPDLLIDSDVMSEEKASNITNEEGQIIYGKDAANGNKIRYQTPGQVAPYLFEDLQGSRNEFDNIWGIHSTTRGEREGRETLGGRKLLKQADLGRIDLVARQLERAIDGIAEYFTQLIKLYYTSEKTFSIIGSDGLRFIKNFSNKKVGDVKLVVKPGSTLPRDEITIHDEAIILYQNKAIGIRTLYRMLKLPNIPEAIDDFIETQSGAILQRKPTNPPIIPQGGGVPLNEGLKVASEQPIITPT
jgi:hypothetical protein